jgi:hypothetical protein
MMKNPFTIPAYFWAVICMLLIPITFMGNNYFAQKFARLPFMKVNPVFTGGDVARSYVQDSMNITIYKPVFESLIGTSSRGFVQVKFSSANQLPSLIHSAIDYDADGKPDFDLNINTLTNDTKFESLSQNVSKIDVSSKVKDYWIVRVKILNTNKK